MRVAVSVRLRMFESLDSRVVRVLEVDFSISRRMVRLGVQRGGGWWLWFVEGDGEWWLGCVGREDVLGRVAF